MRGISNVIATSTLILIALTITVMILPWAWNAMSSIANSAMEAAALKEYLIKTYIEFVPPPAINPYGTEQQLLIYNKGKTVLTDVIVKMMDDSYRLTDLTFKVLRADGDETNWITRIDKFWPGDLIIARVPARGDYIGYKFILQSKEYAESFTVGE